jgi:hypothetical protein
MSYRPYQIIVNAAVSQAGASQSRELENNSGAAIAYLQPVTVDAGGDIKAIDVSDVGDAVKVVGVATESIADGAQGSIATSGVVEDIPGPLDFGDFVYVSKTGGLTADLPTDGVDGFVSGDFVIRVGVVVKNASDPAQKDLLIAVALEGQL